MNPRLFDVLHDPPDVHLFTVGDRIYVNLDVIFHKLVDEDRVLRVGANTRCQVEIQIRTVVDDLHAPPPEHVRGPHHDRVAELPRDLSRLVGAPGGPEPGMRNAELRKQVPEPGAVLGEVYGVRTGAEDLDTVLLQLAGELQGALAPELQDDALGPLAPHDLQDVLGGERLEVEAGGGVVVGRDGLRVGVDHHRVVSGLFYSVARVNAGVVELDTLTDAIRPAPEHDDGGILPALYLVLGLVGRVVVRRLGGELPGTRVHGLVRRVNSESSTHAPHHLGRAAGGNGEGLVGEPDPLELL